MRVSLFLHLLSGSRTDSVSAAPLWLESEVWICSPPSLPSLRPLLDVNYLPLTDMRIARTFCFSNQGQALYLTSPTEIQRISYIQETCDNLQVRLGGRTLRSACVFLI